MYAVGGIDLDVLTVKIADVTNRIEILKNDFPEPPELSFEDAKEIFSNAKELLTGDADNDQKRAILQSLISKIVLSGDNVEIHWRFE